VDNQIKSAANLLSIVSQETDTIGVAVSFGKDSLATLDLCSKLFKRLEGYYLFRVRDMEIVTEWIRQARDRWGIQIRQYPHFDLSRCYRNAVLQPHWAKDVPRIKLPDIERKFRADTEVSWIAYGWRRNDSFSRALIMKKCAGFDPASRRVFPIRTWKRIDVLAYLQANAIPLPETFGRKDQGGLDFHPQALETLRRRFPGDWERWKADFPFSEIQLPPESPLLPGGNSKK
jgi:3'-phosphoadenosine 5'-phosphosulfate sulfotransferase (PAPS reductase)/FAD synthetase